ncbi:MAG: amidohydrolase family protein [Peptococcaceae bacterium]|nr:amidohydrolase family protein [Peptococcaceae bacterium]
MTSAKYPEIIDIHSHIYPEKIASIAVSSIRSFYEIPMHGKGTVHDLAKLEHRAGIERFVVSSTATSPQQVPAINNFLAEVSERFTQVLSFGTIHPEFPSPKKAINQIISLGLKGVKLHPDFQKYNIDDPLMFPIYEAIEGQLPILFHIGDNRMDYSSPYRLVKILDHFPGLTAIAAHLGGYRVWHGEAQALLGREVYIDTSSSLMFLNQETAVNIIRQHGINKVLFGTDYPMWSPQAELKRFLSLGLTKEENQAILSENAKKVLGL